MDAKPGPDGADGNLLIFSARLKISRGAGWQSFSKKVKKPRDHWISNVLNLTNIGTTSAIAIYILLYMYSLINNHTYYPGAGYPHQAGGQGTGSNVP